MCRGSQAQKACYAQAQAIFAKGNDFDPSMLPKLFLITKTYFLADFLMQEQ